MSGLPAPEYSNSEDVNLTSQNVLKDRTSQQIEQQSSINSESNLDGDQIDENDQIYKNQTIETNVDTKDDQYQEEEEEKV